MTAEQRIVLATPHARNDRIERTLSARPGVDLLRVRSREELDVETLTAFAPTWVFFPHWSWRIPQDIHERFRCIIFHMTDVPFGRGGSPLQNLIVRGHQETVMTALRCVEGMDAGDVYLKRPLSLQGTAEEILFRAGDLIGEMIVQLIEEDPVAIPQEGEPTVFTRRRPEDGDLALADGNIRRVYDMIRMLDADGYPSAFLEAHGLRLEFDRASFKGDRIVADVRIRAMSEPPDQDHEP